jgi:WD40 repeat protein
MAASLDKLKMVKDYPGRGVLFRMARVPASRRLFFGSSDFKVYEYDLSTAKPEPKELGTHASYVTGLALAGSTLISGSYDGKLICWDIEGRKQVRSVDAHAKWIRNVVISPDGQLAASVADDMVCRLWEVASGRMVHELRGHQEKTPHHFPSMLYNCAFTPDGKHLATADKVGHIVVWDTAAGKQVTTLEAPVMYTWDPVQRRHSIGGIRGCTFSPDCRLLVVGGIGKIGNIDHLDGPVRVEVFDWQKGERVWEFSSDKLRALVECVRFHPKGDYLLAGGGANDGFLLFLDVATKKVLRQEKVSTHVQDLLLDDPAETLWAAGHGKLVMYSL